MDCFCRLPNVLQLFCTAFADAINGPGQQKRERPDSVFEKLLVIRCGM